ncbi:MAG TPA: ATP-binding protein, partial [Marmoricola sp.]|nr:ATP-binding protein [Marmoricola sp.]
GPVTLRLWVDHDQVVTTITDAGPGFDDPFIGYTMQSDRPGSGRPGPPGMGLWLARQMCDELAFRHDEDGFTVRLRADLDVRG